MKAFSALLICFLWLPAAQAAEKANPSGKYVGSGGGDLALMVAGSKAVAVYWGEHLTAADRSCSCQCTFEKGTDGQWRSTAGDAVTMRLDAKGVRIDDDKLECCGSGAPTPSALYSDSTPPERCQVVSSRVAQLKPGATVLGVEVPDWAGLEPPSDTDQEGPQHLVRAPAKGTDVLLIVPDSALRCEDPGRDLARAQSSALGLFKAGKPRDAAVVLLRAVGAEPWKIDQGNVVAFNDLGFFLEQAKLNQESVDVLSTVVAAFPDRTVAYLNLGDAYVGLGKTAEAKAAYRRYVELMDKAGLRRKIPGRVNTLLQD